MKIVSTLSMLTLRISLSSASLLRLSFWKKNFSKVLTLMNLMICRISYVIFMRASLAFSSSSLAEVDILVKARVNNMRTNITPSPTNEGGPI